MINSYTYDKNGNILTVSDGTNTTSYTYDSANQLIREDNQAAGYTMVWSYDEAGNILYRETHSYTTSALFEGMVPNAWSAYLYDDSDWGDLLTYYNGNTITYDEIGNPLNDGTWTYTWEHGRQLASITRTVPIRFLYQPGEYGSYYGDIVTFRATADGEGVTYQWEFSTDGEVTWQDYTGEGYNTDRIDIQLTPETHGTWYRCAATDVYGNSVQC